MSLLASALTDADHKVRNLQLATHNLRRNNPPE